MRDAETLTMSAKELDRLEIVSGGRKLHRSGGPKLHTC